MQTAITTTTGDSNTSSGYFDGTSGSGWVFDAFGDNVTYSTNTLEKAVTVS